MTELGSNDRPVVMISSTTLDLPDHRKKVFDACLRLSLWPEGMEQLPASSDDAIAVSLELVDKADIYLGVFAHRYGHVPKILCSTSSLFLKSGIELHAVEIGAVFEHAIDRMQELSHDRDLGLH
ncbi:MAG: DUF4062 domain-containing protein, partial [Acidobacteriota bacterium]